MLRKIIVHMIFIFALIFPYELGKADHCDICLVDECYAAFETGPDGDGDGMNDNLEMQLAIQFKPVLILGNANSEKPYKIPGTYSVPPYSCKGSSDHCMPGNIVSDGTVYYHVRPYGGDQQGQATYIEIAYWYYFPWSYTHCKYSGDYSQHGHDWEHIALALSVPPESSTGGESFLARN